MLDTTVAAANSALNRARRALERLVDAMERSDVDAVVAELTADAAWSMPPDSTWYTGDALAAFLVEWPLRSRWRHLPARANGQPAIGSYRWDEAAGAYLAEALDVYTLRGDRIAQVTAFKLPEIFPSFGLPERVGA